MDVDKRVLLTTRSAHVEVFPETRSNKTHLYYLGLPASRVRDVDQIRLEVERSKAGGLEGFPPLDEEVKVPKVVDRMDLELHLADGELAMGVRVEERRERLKLGGFDVDLEDVDEFVT
jgi:hypothetical protein